MYKFTKLVDVSCWTGRWPFIDLRYNKLSALEEKLRSVGVTKAYVAPIEAILEQDPKRADKTLLASISGSFFSPVVVVDISYANWRECAALALNDGRVRMIKLLPNYHMYKLDEVETDALVSLTQPRRIVISIQMKVEDPRAQYKPMQITNVTCADVVGVLKRFPEQTFILNCLTESDIRSSGEVSGLDNVYMDVSCAERQDTLAALKEIRPLDKFLFASHSPFHFPEGSLNKLKYAGLDPEEVDKPAYVNAEKIL